MPKPMSNLLSMPSDWTDYLLMNAGKPPRPKGNLANCLIALAQAPEWKDVLVWNEFTHLIEIGRKTPWGVGTKHAWSDNDDRKTAQWLQHHNIEVPTQIAHEAVLTTAHENTVNPLLDFLNELQWDNWRRIDDWLTFYLGVEETDYTRAVGRKWLISAVARAFQPGCKVDHCLILEGPQGLQKSTALKTLAGPDLFSDAIPHDLGSKESAIFCNGVWIIEFAELEGIMSSPSKIETVKAFMSREDDRYRPPYGKHPVTFPRQCVFAATTNKEAYMYDSTGNRRFWPVRCQSINIKALQRDRTQLWAEAVYAYRDLNEDWWLDRSLEPVAANEQTRRMESDPWQEVVSDWLTHRAETCVNDVLTECIGKKSDGWTRLDQMQVARCLKSAGWEKYRVAGKGNVRWRQNTDICEYE